MVDSAVYAGGSKAMSLLWDSWYLEHSWAGSHDDYFSHNPGRWLDVLDWAELGDEPWH
jgi:hypothetical protein